jgi:hypothetical protein
MTWGRGLVLAQTLALRVSQTFRMLNVATRCAVLKLAISPE